MNASLNFSVQSKPGTLLDMPIKMSGITTDGATAKPTVKNPQTSSRMTQLIIVCCHAIYRCDRHACDPYNESYWLLQPFQKSTAQKPGEHETFILHIQAALNTLQFGFRGEESTVVFSGGATAGSKTALSEARSYGAVMRYLSGEAWAESVAERVLLEERATDSYQNLLFSIIQFRKRTGEYPSDITVITHTFKEERILVFLYSDSSFKSMTVD